MGSCWKLEAGGWQRERRRRTCGGNMEPRRFRQFGAGLAGTKVLAMPAEKYLDPTLPAPAQLDPMIDI